MEVTPATVPEAKQAGAVRACWAWTEPSVWTERMLSALERGVKGGCWFSLIDNVNQTLTGWFAYFKHSHRTAFPPLDKWTRMRLRTILRQRQNGKAVPEGRITFVGPILSLCGKGCSICQPPVLPRVNPLGGEPLTGEPDAGDPPVRIGGRGSETNRFSLPLYQAAKP